jgi:hypothetical protein
VGQEHDQASTWFVDLIPACLGSEMRNDLMTVEIEIDPAFRAAAFFTLEYAAIKLAGRVKVVNGKRKVKKVSS